MKTALFILTFFLFPLSVSAESVSSDFPINLPHALPWDDGTTVWTNWLAWDTGSGWALVYHNSDLSVNAGGYIIAQPWLDSGHNYFTTGNNGTSWSSGTSNHLSASPGIFFDTHIQSNGGVPCRERMYSSDTIFAIGDRDAAAYCTDIVPYVFADPIFYRINLESDNYTFQTETSESAPLQIINNDTSDYVSVPDPISDPAGFVAALLTNMGIWLYNLVIPADDYFTLKYDELSTNFSTTYPIFFDIRDMFDTMISGITAGSFTPISISGLSLGGGSYNFTIIDSTTLPSGTLDTFKTWFGLMMYVGTAFWVIRKGSRIFSS